MALDRTSRRIGKLVCIYSGKHDSLRQALNQYMRECNCYMNKQTIFQTDNVQTIARDARDLLIQDISMLGTPKTFRPLIDRLFEKKSSMLAFRARNNWLLKFLVRHNLFSKSGMWSEVFLNDERVAEAWLKLQRKIRKVSIQNIINTDEVLALHWCFQRTAVNDVEFGTSSSR